MYQSGAGTSSLTPHPVQVVLILDVPPGFTELPLRTAQLADEYGSVIARSIPGVHARPAVITSADRAGGPTRETGGVRIHPSRRSVIVDGHALHLSYRELELLLYLAEHPHRTVSRQELMEQLWDDRPAAGRTVDTHVRRLRVKLGRHARVITTIRGGGYRFDMGADVHYLRDGATG
ncbi:MULTISPECIES: winged helix-turn-helix domain-containing protein [Mycobacteriaceae]|uniref:winged helix-turn-helix domain-containing protein n=1 Tax=Mycobacteriaceae TaxID=1762 RepID=UPI0005EFE5A9|nr:MULTISPECIES: winged helix-turn-helix domain-containing protein [Mycobacteriaceae]AMO06304.1 response regulator [Mycolicibacterium neoaurum]AXK75349.1 winged helix family transcriptional regulator [Mycolicibacterium neoaurum]KUM08286.1 transcriptional regulator [Mycolicibacterium neoaurum]